MPLGDHGSIVFGVITGFWAFVAVIVPAILQFIMRGSPIKGIVQIMCVMTAACCYLFWLCAFLFQLNPLLGPQLETNLIRLMQLEWQGIDPTHVSIHK